MIKSLSNSHKGFTLIELMVAIAIVAVLATIGFTLFQNTQTQARDGRRRQDIDAIASALEQKFVATSGTYSLITGADFSAQTLPVDPLDSGEYKYRFNTATDAIGSTSSDPSTVANSSKYMVCARLEGNNGNRTAGAGTTGSEADPLIYYCRVNQQQ